jgi:hypothetical protein
LFQLPGLRLSMGCTRRLWAFTRSTSNMHECVTATSGVPSFTHSDFRQHAHPSSELRTIAACQLLIAFNPHTAFGLIVEIKKYYRAVRTWMFP